MDWIFIVGMFVAIGIFIITFNQGLGTLKYLFYFWIICFHIGPRGINFMDTKIYFIEGVTWLIFLMFLLRFNLNILSDYKKIFPKITTLLFIVCIGGLFISVIERGRIYASALEEFRVFLTIMPSFYLVSISFRKLDVKIKGVISILAIGGIILTIGGITGYIFPAIGDILSQGPTHVEANLGEGKAIIRGGAGFWGILIVAAYYNLLVFPVYSSAKLIKKVRTKTIYITTVFLLLVCITLTGHRSAWLGLLLAMALFSFLMGAKGITGVILLFAIILPFIPEEILLRFNSSFDSSGRSWAGRLERYDFAWRMFKSSPLFGVGWSSAGWVHNCFLQLIANLGIVGSGVFFVWLGRIILKSISVYRKARISIILKRYLIGFIAAVISFSGPMAAESVINWTPIMVPFWFCCAFLYNINNNFITEKHTE